MQQTFNIMLISDDDGDLASLLSIEKELNRQLWSHVYAFTNTKDVVDECDLVVIGNVKDNAYTELLLSKLHKTIPTVPISKIMELKPGIVSAYLNGYISTNAIMTKSPGPESKPKVGDLRMLPGGTSIWSIGLQQRIKFESNIIVEITNGCTDNPNMFFYKMKTLLHEGPGQIPSVLDSFKGETGSLGAFDVNLTSPYTVPKPQYYEITYGAETGRE